MVGGPIVRQPKKENNIRFDKGTNVEVTTAARRYPAAVQAITDPTTVSDTTAKQKPGIINFVL